ncbi:MAG: bacterioferritin-associated ferredoxin [Pseudomonadales bacterium]|nr:bacterioferritin-associated ferredoxin [Pseudomonadales bacterium]
MYVCLCKGITDSQLKEAVRSGASSFKEVSKQYDVATQCGKCALMARDIVREEINAQSDSSPLYYEAV